MAGRPLRDLQITEAERGELKRLARRPKSAQALAQQASIVLHCAEGLSNNEVADRLGIASATVGTWRSRFRHERLQGLSDAPRFGTTSQNRRRRNQSSRRQDVDVAAERLDALEYARVGSRDRSRNRRSCASGIPLVCNRTAPRSSYSPQTRYLSGRLATSWDCTCRRRKMRLSCASMRNRKSKRWTVRNRSFPCARACPSGSLTTTCAME